MHTEKPGEGPLPVGQREQAGPSAYPCWRGKGREDSWVGRMGDEGREEARE